MPEPSLTPSAVAPVRRALLSVHDKTGVAELARELAGRGVRLVSTGGTAAHLKEAGLDVSLVEDETGYPEILGGRVKTLHPKIFGGVLADETRDDHARDLVEAAIEAFDLVVVNLYPFEKTVAGGGSREESIEMIDVGGTALIRAAAKNHARVAVVVDAADYARLSDEIRATGGTTLATRRHLAARAFARTAAYDGAIARYFAREGGPEDAFPESFVLSFERLGSLRYGENPHQRAAVYGNPDAPPDALIRYQMLQGKELSFNNLLDLDSAVTLARDFDVPAAVIVKHNNPCGAAIGDSLVEAFGRAFACDPLAAFGGIIAIRGVVDGAIASLVLQHFVEVVAADDFTTEATDFFAKKPNIRLLKLPVSRRPAPGIDWKRIDGGLLVQDADTEPDQPRAWRTVSQRKPTMVERAACELAWRVARRVKSNAIVLANARQTIGIGAGQMSRVDACRLAAAKPVLPVVNCGAASDAFFPFRDGVDILAQAGVTAIVAPGGSIRDQEIVAAADEHQMAYMIAPRRHFRH
ncbi:MAG: bifunctional phosphoribosylaminoimidazolecarboxamide formyltransferase/IMP cyclohydrolase [Acidobacteria bacterium]|nr:bifunctional phosphoribosylaminoimidazolecarboxamide formyltransferase/IMP cyclohydrolase [Acidobacteriota bacterium]MCA1609362.1 bifunctional phosphoribosylaminoimidazolecarboxamide formyltransferase/IMP cyclohydrolase [Acidobacteriota bacterium]